MGYGQAVGVYIPTPRPAATVPMVKQSNAAAGQAAYPPTINGHTASSKMGWAAAVG